MKKIRQNKDFLTYTPSKFSPEEFLMHRALEFLEELKEKIINGDEIDELIPDLNSEINYYEERLGIKENYTSIKDLKKELKEIEKWDVID